MQIVWEANTADFRKRKRAVRACLSCQKRKKRCPHTFDVSTEIDAFNDGGSEDESSDAVRFIGDLNPESIIHDLSTRAKDSPRPSRLGVFVEKGSSRSSPFLDKAPAPSSRVSQSLPGADILSYQLGNAHQRQYLQDVGAFRVLPASTVDLLIVNYFSYLDNILEPLINGDKFLRDFKQGTANSFLILAISIVAAKTPEVEPYLKLSGDGPSLQPLAFARALYTGLDAAMRAGLVKDRLTQIQIFGLLSLHNDGPGGLEDASMHMAQAIHLAHTAGFQIESHGRRKDDYPARLYWCLWSLDKLNACLGGRPVMIADRDIGIGRVRLGSETAPAAFDIWFALSDLLTQVIAFYRPTVDQEATGWEEGFPAFDEVTGPSFHDTLQDVHHKLLELFYHVIAILTCRAGNALTLSYHRRVIAASHVQRILSKGSAVELPPLPVIPYAASLAMTVAYRQIRDSKSVDEQMSARAELVTRCEILESLSSRWWSANAMAKLGRKVLDGLQGPTAGDTSKAALMMEDAVAPCTNGGRTQIGDSRSEDNALAVLSSVAEAHANSAHMPDMADFQTWPEHTGSGEVSEGYDRNSTITAPHAGDAIGAAELFDGNFDDFDAIFGDFVDLSMPTMFQDRLFESTNLFDLPDGRI